MMIDILWEGETTVLMIEDGRYIWVNPEAETILGSTNPEILRDRSGGGVDIDRADARLSRVPVDFSEFSGMEPSDIETFMPGVLRDLRRFVGNAASWPSNANAVVTRACVEELKKGCRALSRDGGEPNTLRV